MKTKLFETYQLGNVPLKNRIVMAPMCMFCVEAEDGKVTDFHIQHYAARAVGQVGMLIVEATGITPIGRIDMKDLGIWSDDYIEGMTKLAKAIKDNGSVAAIQLNHAGRKANVKEEIIAPSSVAFDENSKVPVEMTVEQIQETVKAFQDAAVRVKKSGFDVIELHGAHGYLISQFLSPLANKREDEYGGSLVKRFRFLRETIEAVKVVWDGPLIVRVSATDYLPEGATIEDHIEYAKWMKDLGVDLVDVSSGGVVLAKIDVFPGYQVPLSDKIKHDADVPTGVVGIITSGTQAEEILQKDQADLICLGRELLRDPYWPYRAALELGEAIETPYQYKRGWMGMDKG